MISSDALDASGFCGMKRRENGRKNARKWANVAQIAGFVLFVAVYRSSEFSGVNTYTRKPDLSCCINVLFHAQPLFCEKWQDLDELVQCIVIIYHGIWKLWIPLRFQNQHVDVCVQKFGKIMPYQGDHLLHFLIRGDSDNVGGRDRGGTRFNEAWSLFNYWGPLHEKEYIITNEY